MPSLTARSRADEDTLWKAHVPERWNLMQHSQQRLQPVYSLKYTLRRSPAHSPSGEGDNFDSRQVILARGLDEWGSGEYMPFWHS